MNAPTSLQPSFRAGTFFDLQSADRAVARLLAARFPKEQISVLCTDEVKDSHFRQLGYERPENSSTSDEGVAGASVGAMVGGFTAIAVGAATGAVPLIIAGAAGISGGSAIGGFLGTIMSGESENEFIRFYDEELRSGKILILVEDQSSQAEAKLAQAVLILNESARDHV